MSLVRMGKMQGLYLQLWKLAKSEKKYNKNNWASNLVNTCKILSKTMENTPNIKEININQTYYKRNYDWATIFSGLHSVKTWYFNAYRTTCYPLDLLQAFGENLTLCLSSKACGTQASSYDWILYVRLWIYLFITFHSILNEHVGVKGSK